MHRTRRLGGKMNAPRRLVFRQGQIITIHLEQSHLFQERIAAVVKVPTHLLSGKHQTFALDAMRDENTAQEIEGFIVAEFQDLDEVVVLLDVALFGVAEKVGESRVGVDGEVTERVHNLLAGDVAGT